MASTTELLGAWHGAAVFRRGAQVGETLVFRKDGTGFLELYAPARQFTEHFRWVVTEMAELQLNAIQVSQPDQARKHWAECESGQSIVVPFRVTLETTRRGRRLRILRFAYRPWPGTSKHYRFGGCSSAHATFQAPAFQLEEEVDLMDRGKALARHLRRQLRERGVPVGPIGFTFFGCCQFWQAKLNGQKVELAAGWDEQRQEWWLWARPPKQGSGEEVETLCRVLQEILGAVESLSNLEWHTDEDWNQRARERASPPP